MSLTAPRTDLALAALRVAAGTIFAAHGAQKLFVYGLAGVTGAFAQMGVPLPGLVGPAIAILEFAGGVALALGLLSRLVAFGLAVDMLGAIVLVHLQAGFFLPNGIEFVLALFAMAVTVALAGGGRYAVDAYLPQRRS